MRASSLSKFSSVAGVPVVALVIAVVVPIVLIWLAPGLAAIAGLLYISAKMLGEAWAGMAHSSPASPLDVGRWTLAGALGLLFLAFVGLPALRYYLSPMELEETIQCPVLKARLRVRMVHARFGDRILNVTECERYGGRPLCEKFCMSVYFPVPTAAG